MQFFLHYEQSLLLAFFPDGGKQKDALYCEITSKPYFLLPNWFFECKQLFVDKTDGSNWAGCTKYMAIRPGFETVS